MIMLWRFLLPFLGMISHAKELVFAGHGGIVPIRFGDCPFHPRRQILVRVSRHTRLNIASNLTGNVVILCFVLKGKGLVNFRIVPLAALISFSLFFLSLPFRFLLL